MCELVEYWAFLGIVRDAVVVLGELVLAGVALDKHRGVAVDDLQVLAVHGKHQKEGAGDLQGLAVHNKQHEEQVGDLWERVAPGKHQEGEVGALGGLVVEEEVLDAHAMVV